MTPLTDTALWRASANGDPDAFGVLFDRHSRRIYNYLFRRCGDWATAEDMLSDALANTVYQMPGELAIPDGPEYFSAEVTKLLDSGTAKEDGHVDFEGRDAVRIVSDDGSQTYIVDAKTGEPLQWQTKGTTGSVTLRITYEKLPATEANSALAELAKQHPGATVDTDPQHYQDAIGRLAAKG